ncbi:hypothetical protein CKO51_28830 [Rhodopirellula sp. SM50]|nr:hypothetical protein CKO51_28830 [Rhodopirellula sp. SM50]
MNPYEPTCHADETGPIRGPRSVWLLLITATFATACIASAALILVETMEIAGRQGSWNAELTKGATASAIFGLLGCCWLCSSLLYWVRRKRFATVVNLGAIGLAALLIVLATQGLIL